MTIPITDYNHLEKELLKQSLKRQKKRKPKMKVSGRQVIKLKEIIAKNINSILS